VQNRGPFVTENGNCHGGTAARADRRRRVQMMTASGEASGLVNRSSSPGSVRYMSVTTVVQRRLLTGDDTR
jgi:hypothetical protein